MSVVALFHFIHLSIKLCRYFNRQRIITSGTEAATKNIELNKITPTSSYAVRLLFITNRFGPPISKREVMNISFQFDFKFNDFDDIAFSHSSKCNKFSYRHSFPLHIFTQIKHNFILHNFGIHSICAEYFVCS